MEWRTRQAEAAVNRLNNAKTRSVEPPTGPMPVSPHITPLKILIQNPDQFNAANDAWGKPQGVEVESSVKRLRGTG